MADSVIIESLRRDIRALTLATPMSVMEWRRNIASLKSIATVIDDEDRQNMIRTSSTLWERPEYSIRVLLEEGKLNLLLRCAVAFKSFHKDFLTNPDFSEV